MHLWVQDDEVAFISILIHRIVFLTMVDVCCFPTQKGLYFSMSAVIHILLLSHHTTQSLKYLAVHLSWMKGIIKMKGMFIMVHSRILHWPRWATVMD